MKNNRSDLKFTIQYDQASRSFEAKCIVESDVTHNIYDPTELDNGKRIIMLESIKLNLSEMIDLIDNKIRTIEDGNYYPEYDKGDYSNE